MKTHEVLKVLETLRSDLPHQPIVTGQGKTLTAPAVVDALIKLLQQAPNMEIEQTKLMKKTDDLAVSLKSLVSLSKYNKQQWVSIIDEFGLDISLNPRASARDVVGKVLTYLDEHPEVLKQIEKKGKVKAGTADLEETLSKLIGYKP
jgi:hypothetical protein